MFRLDAFDLALREHRRQVERVNRDGWKRHAPATAKHGRRETLLNRLHRSQSE